MKLCHMHWTIRSILALLLVTTIIVSVVRVADNVSTCETWTHLAQTQAPPVWSCCTQYGRCGLGRSQPLGSTCYCTSQYGPVAGAACN